MRQQRLARLAYAMQERGITQVIISEDRNLYYYLGQYEESMERLRILLVDDCGGCRCYANELFDCALPGFVDSKNEEKTERNAGYLVVSHSGGGMLRQGTRKGIRRTPANRGMRAHRIVKSLDISEDVCHGLCP